MSYYHGPHDRPLRAADTFIAHGLGVAEANLKSASQRSGLDSRKTTCVDRFCVTVCKLGWPTTQNGPQEELARRFSA